MDLEQRSPLKEMQIDSNIPIKKLKNSDLSQDHVILQYLKLSENATAPTRGSKLAAGFDLYR